MVGLAQLVRAPGCGPGGHRFDPDISPHYVSNIGYVRCFLFFKISKLSSHNVMKIIFDVSWVLLSIVLSLIFFDGKLYGTREGTIISALLVGVTVKIFRPLLVKPLTKILKR